MNPPIKTTPNVIRNILNVVPITLLKLLASFEATGIISIYIPRAIQPAIDNPNKKYIVHYFVSLIHNMTSTDNAIANGIDPMIMGRALFTLTNFDTMLDWPAVYIIYYFSLSYIGKQKVFQATSDP